MKRLALLTLMLAIAITSALVPLSDTNAVTASDWQAERIVDDSIFTNTYEMSVAEIQEFLNQRNPSCDTNGTKPAVEYGRPDLTRAQYAALRGWHGPPYVCLKDYYEVPKYSPGDYIPANNFSGSIPEGAISAAQIIYDAAKINNISAKAILIKIATESAGPLTADPWPLQSQYTYAMGSHCPDSGPGGTANCDRNYAGFSMQVSSGAGLLRWYLDSMDQPWWPYKRYGAGVDGQIASNAKDLCSDRYGWQNSNCVGYAVASRCGGTVINIQSRATAALYTYTPYQPNQAALNNMYGTGDDCSAYGNRNFWRVWNDWFGGTTGPAYAWEIAAQLVYIDSERTMVLPYNAYVTPGQEVYMTIKATNIGNQVWRKSTVNLATTSPRDRQSKFRSPDWVSSNRPATMLEDRVAPGQTATFNATLQAPETPGNYGEGFSLVAEYITWMNDPGMYIPLRVHPSRTINLYSDSARTKVLSGNPTQLYVGKPIYGRATIVNDSPQIISGRASLATTSPQDRRSVFEDTSWISENRLGSLTSDIGPGELGTIDFTLQVPESAVGNHTEQFGLVIDGSHGRWIEFDTLKFDARVDVVPPDFLSKGTELKAGQSALSSNGYYRLTMQSDGNLVLYTPTDRPIWATNTEGRGANRVVMQSDGNLVLYTPTDRPIWATNTEGRR